MRCRRFGGFSRQIIDAAGDRLQPSVPDFLPGPAKLLPPEESANRLAPDIYLHKYMKYNHIGIPTNARFDGEIDLPDLKMTVSDHENNPFGIQWQRYWETADYPALVKTVPHVAFEVEDLGEALEGQKILIAPNSPSKGLMVAFIEVNGAPIELMQYLERAGS